LISNPGNNDSPLKLPSDPHNPPCGKCTHDAEERKVNAKRVWSTKRSQGNIGRHLDILTS